VGEKESLMIGFLRILGAGGAVEWAGRALVSGIDAIADAGDLTGDDTDLLAG
jgi:hypothetical protein